MFDPSSKIKKIKGKDYLEVKWRIVWFREDHPEGAIVTDIVSHDPIIIKATIHNNDGVILGTGMGSPKIQGVSASRPFEGAETAAIGRALAHAGYGTQFTGEDEGEHLSDAPIETVAKSNKKSAKKETKAKSWPAEYVQAVIDTGSIDNTPHAVGWLNLVNPKSVELVGVLMTEYQKEKKSGLTSPEAADAVQELNK